MTYAPRLDAFSEFFELEPSPVAGQPLRQKRKEKKKKERQKKIKNLKSLQTLATFSSKKIKILISAHAKVKRFYNTMLMERSTSCQFANAFLRGRAENLQRAFS